MTDLYDGRKTLPVGRYQENAPLGDAANVRPVLKPHENTEG